MRIAQLIVAGSIIAGSIGFAHAQATAAAGSVVVVPVVAQTASYSTEVIVRNPNTAPITLHVKFYEGHDPANPNPGLKSCTDLTVAANESKPFTLAGQCVLGGGSHFGMLVLEDAAAQKTNLFFAYSRAQTPGGNGFSVEGFPIGVFSGAPADVVGLKRQAAAPVYQSNCFVAALGEAVNYQLVLRDGTTNAAIGSKSGALAAFEQVRLLDVFAQAGVPAGNRTNIRANFTVTSGNPALIGFCTVQESTFFGADFRIAKSVDSLDNGQKRTACIGLPDCAAPLVPASAEHITDVTLRNVYSMIITQPDFVQCNLVSDRLSDLQMRLRQWGDPFSSAPFAGGTGQTSFYVFTGNRNAVNGGTATRWFIDVSFRDGGNATVPIDFGITCHSGNGTEIPWFRGTALKNF